jgi:hypothetical protein
MVLASGLFGPGLFDLSIIVSLNAGSFGPRCGAFWLERPGIQGISGQKGVIAA